MDQMQRLLRVKYLVHVPKKAVIKPVKIDFPLPTSVQGIEGRLNSLNTYQLPQVYIKKNKPVHLVGQTVRIAYLLQNWQDYIDKIVTVVGWARQARLQAKDTILFVKLVDGSNTVPLQVVVDSKISNWQELKKGKKDYSFKFTGLIIKSLGKGQDIQLSIKGTQAYQKAIVFGRNDDDKYPLNSKDISIQTLRQIAHLRPRTQLFSAMTRVKNNLAYATHQFFQNNGFLYIHTPLITGSDCEGAGEMFQVTTILPESGLIKDIPQVNGKIDYSKQFFWKPTGLTVSGQLAVENFACSMSNVYTFGPTFRAEVSHTRRHMAQFWMIEPELAFADVFDDMQCAQAYIQFCIRFVLENNMPELQFLDKKKAEQKKKLDKKDHEGQLITYLKNLVSGPFGRASYTEAIDILQKCIDRGVVFENDVFWGVDLASQHQRYLCDHVFHKPVILYNYPRDIKAFYMRQNPDGKTVASFDILAPEVGQIVGGSQREERLEVLQARIDQLKLPKQNYWWYLDLRKHGSVPHAGFGLGFQRLVMMVTGIDNIRDVASFPRTPGNAQF